MRVSAIQTINPVRFNNSQPIKEEEPTDYKYPDRPNLFKRVLNALRADDKKEVRTEEDFDIRAEQLDYVV